MSKPQTLKEFIEEGLTLYRVTGPIWMRQTFELALSSLSQTAPSAQEGVGELVALVKEWLEDDEKDYAEHLKRLNNVRAYLGLPPSAKTATPSASALGEDTKRMDWLEAQTSLAISRFNGETIGMTATQSWKGDKLRAMIDKALADTAGKKGE